MSKQSTQAAVALDPMITFDNLLTTQFELTAQEQILLSAYREMGGCEVGKQQQEIIFNLTIDFLEIHRRNGGINTMSP
jgi:hypothetical protein